MTSTNIYNPTYLYIKQHSNTGLKYFGITTRKDPIKYLGSGKYWRNHIKKHGTAYVITLWIQLFEDQESLTDFALLFSEHWDIVNSKEWANMVPEYGINKGGPHFSGRKHSEETRAKLSFASSNITEENRAKKSAARKGKVNSTETKEKISSSHLKLPKLCCPYCGKICSQANPKTYHFDNCKKSPNYIAKPLIQCPHCIITGTSKCNMDRYHFDNCKNKN